MEGVSIKKEAQAESMGGLPLCGGCSEGSRVCQWDEGDEMGGCINNEGLEDGFTRRKGGESCVVIRWRHGKREKSRFRHEKLRRWNWD